MIKNIKRFRRKYKKFGNGEKISTEIVIVVILNPDR